MAEHKPMPLLGQVPPTGPAANALRVFSENTAREGLPGRRNQAAAAPRMRVVPGVRR